MSDKEKIELHTIATYNNKQYELQDLLNNLININLKLQQRIDKAIEYIESDYDNYYGDELYNPLQEIIAILKGGNND